LDTERLIRDIVKNVLDKLKQDGQGSNVQTSSEIRPADDLKPEKPVSTESVPSTTLSNAEARTDRKIVCGVSVRHVHLCREDLDILFGKGYVLNVLRELYNPGYACKETLTIVGPKLTAIQNVRILGPLRKKSQVELAKTDCILLGVDAPVRPSGDLEGSSSCVLVGPNGAIYLENGVIRANRHLHIGPADAEFFGLSDNDLVDIRAGGPKGLTFNNVQVRVAPDFKAEFHVDTDDANAADMVNGSIVELVDATCVSPIPALMADADKIPPAIPDGSFVGEVSDPNLVQNVCSILTGKACTNQQLSDTAEAISSVAKKLRAKQVDQQQSGEAGVIKKTVITVDDLDDYAETGINVDENIILTPLARDEASKREIKITYNE
jgi:putative phosphotransacetylase